MTKLIPSQEILAPHSIQHKPTEPTELWFAQIHEPLDAVHFYYEHLTGQATGNKNNNKVSLISIVLTLAFAITACFFNTQIYNKLFTLLQSRALLFSIGIIILTTWIAHFFWSMMSHQSNVIIDKGQSSQPVAPVLSLLAWDHSKNQLLFIHQESLTTKKLFAISKDNLGPIAFVWKASNIDQQIDYDKSECYLPAHFTLLFDTGIPVDCGALVDQEYNIDVSQRTHIVNSRPLNNGNTKEKQTAYISPTPQEIEKYAPSALLSFLNTAGLTLTPFNKVITSMLNEQ